MDWVGKPNGAVDEGICPCQSATEAWRYAGIDIQIVELDNKKIEYSKTELKENSTNKIQKFEIVLYKDRSTDGNQETGRAGFYVTNDQEEEIHQAHFPAGLLISSRMRCHTKSPRLDCKTSC